MIERLFGTLWLVAARLLTDDEDAASGIIRAGILSWFAVDSLGSIAAGAPLNAALNMGFLVLFLWPLKRRAHTRPQA